MDGNDIDPVDGTVVNPTRGYAQKQSLGQIQMTDDNAEYPFLHVHTMDGKDIDPVDGTVVNPTKGYNKVPRRIVAIWKKKWSLKNKWSIEFFHLARI